MEQIPYIFTIDEVASVVVGENLESRDIVLHRRNNQLQRIKETHRSYDALQYPIIFWQGEDGYDFSIKMINPITGNVLLSAKLDNGWVDFANSFFRTFLEVRGRFLPREKL